jgi:hypothetical protein
MPKRVCFCEEQISVQFSDLRQPFRFTPSCSTVCKADPSTLAHLGRREVRNKPPKILARALQKFARKLALQRSQIAAWKAALRLPSPVLLGLTLICVVSNHALINCNTQRAGRGSAALPFGRYLCACVHREKSLLVLQVHT